MPLKEGAINQILMFAAEADEEAGDIISLDRYKNDEVRRYGHPGGVNARREIENRVLEQTSFVSSGFSQWIANRTVNGVLDNGDLDAFESGIVEALISMGVTVSTSSGLGLVQLGKEVRLPITNTSQTIYIKKDGNDSNSGLESNRAVRTIDRLKTVLYSLDLRNSDVILSFGPGEWTTSKWEMNSCNAKSVSFVGTSSAATKFVDGSNVSSNDAAIEILHGSQLTTYISKMSFSNPIGGYSIKASNFSDVVLGEDLVFEKAAKSHISVEKHSNLEIHSGYDITGISPTHITVDSFSSVRYRNYINNNLEDILINITNSPTFSNAFMYVSDHSTIKFDSRCDYSGTSYGRRYIVELQSLINTIGRGANFLPGNLSGVEQNGGLYV